MDQLQSPLTDAQFTLYRDYFFDNYTTLPKLIILNNINDADRTKLKVMLSDEATSDEYAHSSKNRKKLKDISNRIVMLTGGKSRKKNRKNKKNKNRRSYKR
jgi:hypothetical protein